ncbi:Uncharacterised protein [Mycobacteroides abscessus subsp. abscessus]|nr:Uncharacterised protein [Mycobacteroides abscessus subsp. abscessus]
MGSLSRKSTVRSSGVSTRSRLASSDCGPLGSLITRSRSYENFTSDEVSSCPLANTEPGLSVQRYSVGFSNPHPAARSGLRSPVPGVKFIRNG